MLRRAHSHSTLLWRLSKLARTRKCKWLHNTEWCFNVITRIKGAIVLSKHRKGDPIADCNGASSEKQNTPWLMSEVKNKKCNNALIISKRWLSGLAHNRWLPATIWWHIGQLSLSNLSHTAEPTGMLKRACVHYFVFHVAISIVLYQQLCIGGVLYRPFSYAGDVISVSYFWYGLLLCSTMF